MLEQNLLDAPRSGAFYEAIAFLNENALANIEGLYYASEYVSEDEESALLNAINASPWMPELSRRVQHYGFKYDYRARSVDASMRIGTFPVWLHTLATRLRNDGFFLRTPDQVIVNEYMPGQGIAPHVDCEPCFGETIVSLSLASGIVMSLENRENGEQFSVWLEPRSIIVLTGPARHAWTHGIARRKRDLIKSISIPRTRRVSLTFRTVIQDG